MNSTTILQKGKAFLRPRARLIRALGHDLITNEIVAVQELVKNSYDADAKNVRLTFKGPLEPGQGSLTIRDDGEGMTLEVLKTAWMEPATISKVRRKTSKHGRRMTGEKGIGRFAAARIARTLELRTIARENGLETQMQFDWGAFEHEDRFLDEVKVDWKELEPGTYDEPGTSLHLAGFNDAWNRTSFERLRNELSRLLAPTQGPKDFEIYLALPKEFREFSGPIAPPPVLQKPHYTLIGTVDAGGLINARYSGPGYEGLLTDERKKKLRVILSGGRKPSCGPFSFEFRVWDRDDDSLEPLARELATSLRDLKRDLNAASGISIYRDRFRVLVPEHDWLRLDFRRVQNPTLRLSNNQIVGHVALSADENPGLRDQTNRQGIVDSQALEDLKSTMKEVLTRLEVRRDLARRKTRAQAARGGIFQQLTLEPIRNYATTTYPEDRKLRALVEDQATALGTGIREAQEVIARYRRLATLGQLIDMVLHEGRTPISSIMNEVTLLRKTRSDTPSAEVLHKRLDAIHGQAEVLTLMFKRIAPFSGRRRGRPGEHRIESLIENAFALFEKRIRNERVKVTLPKSTTMVSCIPGDMQIVFVNLLENALYWLEKVTNKAITVEIQPQGRQVIALFSDSGPGVPDEIAEHIFAPYFSTKPEGVGLGLTIAGETLAEHDGHLDLVQSGPLNGATFRVTINAPEGTTDG